LREDHGRSDARTIYPRCGSDGRLALDRGILLELGRFVGCWGRAEMRPPLFRRRAVSDSRARAARRPLSGGQRPVGWSGRLLRGSLRLGCLGVLGRAALFPGGVLSRSANAFATAGSGILGGGHARVPSRSGSRCRANSPSLGRGRAVAKLQLTSGLPRLRSGGRSQLNFGVCRPLSRRAHSERARERPSWLGSAMRSSLNFGHARARLGATVSGSVTIQELAESRRR
jgi:hypothetical protein